MTLSHSPRLHVDMAAARWTGQDWLVIQLEDASGSWAVPVEDDGYTFVGKLWFPGQIDPESGRLRRQYVFNALMGTLSAGKARYYHRTPSVRGQPPDARCMDAGRAASARLSASCGYSGSAGENLCRQGRDVHGLRGRAPRHSQRMPQTAVTHGFVPQASRLETEPGMVLSHVNRRCRHWCSKRLARNALRTLASPLGCTCGPQRSVGGETPCTERSRRILEHGQELCLAHVQM